MFFNLLPRDHLRALAQAFGESEATLRAIVMLALLVAFSGAAVWMFAAFDPSLLGGSGKTEGSERVLRAFLGMGIAISLSVVAGVSGLGHWMHSATLRRLAVRARLAA